MKIAAISMILLLVLFSWAPLAAAVESTPEQGSYTEEETGTIGPAQQGTESEPNVEGTVPDMEKSLPGGEAGSKDNLDWPQED